MALSYQTRDNNGKYTTIATIVDLLIQDDGDFSYIIIKLSNGDSKRYRLKNEGY